MSTRLRTLSGSTEPRSWSWGQTRNTHSAVAASRGATGHSTQAFREIPMAIGATTASTGDPPRIPVSLLRVRHETNPSTNDPPGTPGSSPGERRLANEAILGVPRAPRRSSGAPPDTREPSDTFPDVSADRSVARPCANEATTGVPGVPRRSSETRPETNEAADASPVWPPHLTLARRYRTEATTGSPDVRQCSTEARRDANEASGGLPDIPGRSHFARPGTNEASAGLTRRSADVTGQGSGTLILSPSMLPRPARAMLVSDPGLRDRAGTDRVVSCTQWRLAVVTCQRRRRETSTSSARQAASPSRDDRHRGGGEPGETDGITEHFAIFTAGHVLKTVAKRERRGNAGKNKAECEIEHDDDEPAKTRRQLASCREVDHVVPRHGSGPDRQPNRRTRQDVMNGLPTLGQAHRDKR